MPLTATPMISDAPMVARVLRTRVPAQSAAVPATIAITTDTKNRGMLWCTESGMIMAAMPI
jgi:hypothetical protein